MMKMNNILILISLFSALSISFGFTTNRTEWSVVPQLNPKVSLEVLMKDTQVKAIDDVLRTSDERKSPRHENATTVENPLRGRRFRDVESSPTSPARFTIKLISEAKKRVDRDEKITKSSGKEITSNGPLNVILLLIDDLQKNQQPILEDLRMFPIRGLLEICHNGSESGLPAGGNADCDCDELLRSGVVALLSWAEHVKEMSTSSLYEMPAVYSRRVEIDTRGFTGPQARRIDRQLRQSWQLNDDDEDDDATAEAGTSKPSELPSSPIESSPDLFFVRDNQDTEIAEEAASHWHFSNILSRLRRAMFHTLLGIANDSSSSHHELAVNKHRRSPRRRHSDFHELAARTLGELARRPHERGYLLVATATDAAVELPGALELLRRYILPSNTLIIVTSTCPHEKARPVPFYARGPGAERLFSAVPKSLDELPNAIHAVINEKDCGNAAADCHEAPNFYGPAEPSLRIGGPISMYDEIIEPRGRFARDDKPEAKAQEQPKKSDKDEKVKVPEKKKPEEVKQPAVESPKQKNQDSKSKDFPVDVDVKLRMGELDTAANSQENVSHVSILFVTAVTITLTYTLRY